ncbi:MAG: protein kinase [Deltaproteobacteria bacterium]|jgi:serine/threonine-protein kinase|nr:protein kinase [Deltaproteobacteria bacterium]MBW2537349.1 protein kinase [Deltaproteobacteria bacterium]
MQIGQILDDKYRVIREIGSGSMGAVYEGENVTIHRRVAIKVLHPGVANNASTVQRFEREAQAAGRIGSDHIVEVLDLGALPDGSYYMVMEFLEGTTLRARLAEAGRLQPRQVVPIVQQLLTGLEAAHEARIIHRDLKPDNVFLLSSKAGQSDYVKILDFGVSKFSPLNTEDGLDLTKAGTVVGTPFYMSPEQAKGSKDIDSRSDLYSVGIILYECITGQKPFDAGTFNELIFKIVLETPPPPEQFVPNLDPAFSRVVRKAMARPVDDRYQSAAEMREALSVWLHTGQEELAATQMMDPPPPAPGRDVGPPPSRPLPATVVHEDEEANLATALREPKSPPENPTRIIERPPPPPAVPSNVGQITERPPGVTEMPGAPRSGAHRMAAVAVAVAVVGLAAGGIAAMVITAEDAPRGDAAALGPPETAPPSANEPAESSTAEVEAPSDPDPDSETPDEVSEQPAEAPSAEPRPQAAPAEQAAPARSGATVRPADPVAGQGSPPSSPTPAGDAPAKGGSSPPTKGKGKPGRSIATEL